MSEFTYTYSRSVDFGGQLASGQFATEVSGSSIGTNFLRVDTLADDVYVIFSVALTGPQETTLDGLVAAHVPDPINIISTTNGYIELNSSLADAQAVRIDASNAAGGIYVHAGTGGIAVDTTNGFSLDADAAISIANTAGNITLDTPALIDLNAQSGINIGNDADAAPVNIGTGAAAKNVTLGNTNSTSSVSVLTGTGGFSVDTSTGGAFSIDATGAACNLSLATTGDAQDLTIGLSGSTDSSIIITSSGTGADAIKFNTSGGIDADATGTINFATGSSAGGAITLDASFNNGGISLASGSQGIAINSGTGLIGIGHWSAGDIQVGTSATARNITMGNAIGATAITLTSGTGGTIIDSTGVVEVNSSGGAISIGNDAANFNMNIGTAGSRVITIGNTNASSAVNIISGTWGLTVGNDASSGEIQIAASANAKTVKVGNSTGGSRLFHRWGSGGNITHQPAPTALSDADATIMIAQILGELFTMTPSTARALTLPTAADAVAGISGVAVDDCVDFRIINLGTAANDPEIVLVAGTGGSIVGNEEVYPHVNNAGTYNYSGTGVFRMRFTNVTASSEAYVVYRIA